jgi:hypothetical protein
MAARASVPAAVGHGVFVARHRPGGAGGELDLGHAQQRAARALHHERRQPVVEHRTVLSLSRLDLATRRLGVEAIAQQRQQRLRVGKAFIAFRLSPKPAIVSEAITGCRGGASSL